MKVKNDALWNYSTALYANPDVEKNCLNLQDNFHLNVNIILLAVWLSDEFQEVQTKTFYKQLIKAIEPLQQAIIEPVRASRKQLKQKPSLWPEEFKAEVRSNLLKIELNAEKLQQASLQQQVEKASRKPSPKVKLEERIKRNISHYLAALDTKTEYTDIEKQLIQIAAFIQPAE